MSMPPYEKSFAFKFPEASKEWAYDKNKPLKPENCYAGTARKVWWRCEAYGHEWKTSPMNRRKHGCPTCYNLLRRGRNSKA